MNTNKILNFSCEIGKQLLQNGAEIYRVEESIERILNSYGYKKAEVFAIPSYIIINIEKDENNYTKSVRIKTITNNLHKLDELNNLCRSICMKCPQMDEANELLNEIVAKEPYKLWISFMAYGLVAFFFTLYKSGTVLDSVISFLCGLIVKFMVFNMRRVKANVFFTNLLASIILAVIPLVLSYTGTIIHLDIIIIGAIMLLVPGLAITNVVRDVLAGDFLTALTKLSEVLIVGMAIAIGIAIPITGMKMAFGEFVQNNSSQIDYVGFLPCFYAFLGCFSFSIVFEVRKRKYILAGSAIGAISWLIIEYSRYFGLDVSGYFLATLAVAILSEICARFFKAPATIFLIVGIIPLVPGGGIYYTMYYLINKNMDMFWNQGMKTIAYAGAIAVGCSLVSSTVRILTYKRVR